MVDGRDARRYGNVALLLAGTLAGLILTEALLRILKPQKLFVSRMPLIYETNDATGYRYRPGATGWIHRNFEIDNVIRINSLGFHDVEPQPETGDPSLRIAVVGDSFTAVLHLDIAQSWPKVLQRHLGRALGVPVEVVNLGLDGTGTDDHLAILKEHVPALQPDVVVLAFFENDVRDVTMGPLFRQCYRDYILTYQTAHQREQLMHLVDTQRPGTVFSWLFQEILVFRTAALFFYEEQASRLLRKNILPARTTGQNADQGVKGGDIDEVFQALIELSRRRDFRLIVLPVPAKKSLDASKQTLRRSLRASVLTQLEVADTSAVVRDLVGEDGRAYQDLFWRHDGHLNAYGNRVFGTAVARVLKGKLQETASGDAP